MTIVVGIFHIMSNVFTYWCHTFKLRLHMVTWVTRMTKLWLKVQQFKKYPRLKQQMVSPPRKTFPLASSEFATVLWVKWIIRSLCSRWGRSTTHLYSVLPHVFCNYSFQPEKVAYSQTNREDLATIFQSYLSFGSVFGSCAINVCLFTLFTSSS